MGNDLSSLAGRTPVRALRPSSRLNIARLLDGTIPSDINRLNDIVGFMEVVGLRNEIIEQINTSRTRTKTFLDSWERIAADQGMESPTVLIAIQTLERLRRTDIILQCQETVEEDMHVYHGHHQLTRERRSPDDDYLYITTHDVQSRRPSLYDGFVMYVQEDEEYVRRMVQRAEENQYKLLLPEFHILPGLPTLSAWAFAIKHRCRKLILIISESFQRSEHCEFVVQFATSLSPAARNRKVIPIVIDRNLPIHQILHFIRVYHPAQGFDVLMEAIRSPTQPELRALSRSQSYPQSGNVATVSPVPRTSDFARAEMEPNSTDDSFCSMFDNLSFHQAPHPQEQPPHATNIRHSLPETLYSRTGFLNLDPNPRGNLTGSHGLTDAHGFSRNANTRDANDLGVFSRSIQDSSLDRDTTILTDDRSDTMSSINDSTSTSNNGSSDYLFIQTRGPTGLESSRSVDTRYRGTAAIQPFRENQDVSQENATYVSTNEGVNEVTMPQTRQISDQIKQAIEEPEQLSERQVDRAHVQHVIEDGNTSVTEQILSQDSQQADNSDRQDESRAVFV